MIVVSPIHIPYKYINLSYNVFFIVISNICFTRVWVCCHVMIININPQKLRQMLLIPANLFNFMTSEGDCCGEYLHTIFRNINTAG